MQQLPGAVFINRAPHARLEPTALLQLETVMQQLCGIAFYAVELLFHQHHIIMTALSTFVRRLAAVFRISILLLTKLIKLFHGICLAGSIRQIQLPRLGSTWTSGHPAVLSKSATLLPRISFPHPLFTFVTVTGFAVGLLFLCTGTGFLAGVGQFMLTVLPLVFIT
jgi:hypothetical protein